MNQSYYLEQFHKAAVGLDHHALQQQQLDIETEIWQRCVQLKAHKKTWSDATSRAAIFFFIWVNEQFEKNGRLYYNIHAFKLREWKEYSLTSRAFAEAFRSAFKPFEPQWPNVSVQFGPQNLMQGWITAGEYQVQEAIPPLVGKFLTIAPIIDRLLAQHRRFLTPGKPDDRKPAYSPTRTPT